MNEVVARLTRRRAGRGGGMARRSGERLRRSQWVERAGRAGHVAKGVSYGLIAVLALQVAFGERRQPRDREGVLREVAGGSFGTAVLVALAVGFFAYALWQFVRAAVDRAGEGTEATGLAKRALYGLEGVVYALSGVAAVALVMGSRSGVGGDEQAETARVLDWPLGQWIVGGVGVALVLYGAYNLYEAVTGKVGEDLRQGEMAGELRPWAMGVGVVGHVARGVVFGMVGIFLAKAAIEYEPDEAVGIDGALAKLAAESYGTWLLTAVALGLLAYGLFCLVQARYRQV
jgi:Domain of Unknown Function (DUF1206)